MSWYNKLERRFGNFAPAHLTTAIVFGQVIVYVLNYMNSESRMLEAMVYVPALVLQGEIWRLFTFILIPAFRNPVFFLFGILFFHMMGTQLEHEWGDFKYALYVGAGWLATVAAGFLTPGFPVSNALLLGSIVLAFAWLYPNYEFLAYFILPVKMRWLGWFMWATFAWLLVTGSWTTRVMVLAGILNFLIFFGSDIVRKVRWYMRRNERRATLAMAEREKTVEDAGRVCAVCGRSEASDPDLEFRYCSQCADAACYCIDHIYDHEHHK